MSRPRGKAVQRKLAALATEILKPWGFQCEIDFSRRGGHQQLKVTPPGRDMKQISLELPSSPRSEKHAADYMRQRCQRIIRDTVGAY